MSERRDPLATHPRQPDENVTGEGFAQRWSRRKHEARMGVAGEQAQPAAEGEPPVPAEIIHTDADMPALESLDENSDFSAFLSPGVSDELRRKAMAKLFRLPQFVERCPLDGEFYDCTNMEPLGSIITYDMREEMKRAVEKLAAEQKSGKRSASTAPAAKVESQAETVPSLPATAEADADKIPPRTVRREPVRRKPRRRDT